LLGETTERFRFVIHAYCLLDNHYHAIIQTPDANLSQGMQWLGLSYSSWFHAYPIKTGLARSFSSLAAL
jgi:REP element-mobilizing transposase RayT